METLVRPSGWPLALAGFLVRGRIIPFTPPIVVLPTTVPPRSRQGRSREGAMDARPIGFGEIEVDGQW